MIWSVSFLIQVLFESQFQLSVNKKRQSHTQKEMETNWNHADLVIRYGFGDYLKWREFDIFYNSIQKRHDGHHERFFPRNFRKLPVMLVDDNIINFVHSSLNK